MADGQPKKQTGAETEARAEVSEIFPLISAFTWLANGNLCSLLSLYVFGVIQERVTSLGQNGLRESSLFQPLKLGPVFGSRVRGAKTKTTKSETVHTKHRKLGDRFFGTR